MSWARLRPTRKQPRIAVWWMRSVKCFDPFNYHHQNSRREIRDWYIHLICTWQMFVGDSRLSDFHLNWSDLLTTVLINYKTSSSWLTMNLSLDTVFTHKSYSNHGLICSMSLVVRIWNCQCHRGTKWYFIWIHSHTTWRRRRKTSHPVSQSLPSKNG